MVKKKSKTFKLGTTSFIYPDHILPNVKKLGAFFDEIELLIFESYPEDVLPSKNDVDALLKASQTFNLTYNIHLPTDISLTCDSSEERQKAADTYLKVIERFDSLHPTTHTLHLEMPSQIKLDVLNLEEIKNQQNDSLKQWIENTYHGLKALMANGVNPDILSIETLDYPFSLVEPLVTEFNLPVCIDLGHGIKYGYDIAQVFKTHQSRIPVMHLHGVEFLDSKIKDHTRLDRMPEEHFAAVLSLLENYTGVVSLEVFNLENLNYSMDFLSQFFSDIIRK